MIDFQSISPASAPVTTSSRRRCCPSILCWSNESAELLMVSVLIVGEPTATDDTSASNLAGDAGGVRGRCGDDADDIVDIGDMHAVDATDEFEAAFGGMRHRSSVLPLELLGERCDDDFCIQFPIMVPIL